MMTTPAVCINDITHVIQLVLAPAFLLTAVAGMLNVMTGRLARIIDRGRKLSEEPNQIEPLLKESYEVEHINLEKRRYLASVAITASTLSALLLCLVIFVLFIKGILGLDIQWIVSVLFSASTLALIMGLTFFLREVHLATKTVRIVLPQNRN